MAKRVRVDTGSFAYTSIMERLSHARLKDSFVFEAEDTIYFIAAPGQVGKAIGKKGITIKKAQERFEKKVRVVEFNEDPKTFLQNLVLPTRIESIDLQDDHLLVKDASKKTKGLLIGRDGRTLAFINQVMNHYFHKDVRVE